jgi:hypothetical protein
MDFYDAIGIDCRIKSAMFQVRDMRHVWGGFAALLKVQCEGWSWRSSRRPTRQSLHLICEALITVIPLGYDTAFMNSSALLDYL